MGIIFIGQVLKKFQSRGILFDIGEKPKLSPILSYEEPTDGTSRKP